VADYKAAIQLPPNSSPQLPPSIHLNESFAEYTATYSFSDGVLHAERRLETKARELEPGQVLPYRTFTKAIVDDENRYIPLSGGGVGLAADVSGIIERAIDPEARDLYEQGLQAWQLHNWQAASDAFQRAVDKDPKFAQAWIGLGMLHAGTQPAKAIEELHKAVALEPNQTMPYQALTSLLISQHRQEDALASWKQLENAAPQNPDAREHIAAILMVLKRYSEAAPEWETAVRLEPGKSVLLVALGEAYARAGNKERALSTFEKALKNEPSANELNGIAYALADTSLQLDDALNYAERAVRIEEGETVEIDLNDLNLKEIGTVQALAAYWDTLGWVHFRLGHIDQAEKYIKAAWLVAQSPVVGDHLGQIYEKEGKRQEAIKAYSNTLATHHAPDGTKARLDALHPGDAATGWGVLELQNTRITDVEVSPKPKKHVSAEFFILLAPGPRVAAVKFLNDDDEFPGAKEALKAAKFEMSFPDDDPAQILRRGFIDCEPELAECTIALVPPLEVRSVN
jgi:tetratricopeptide (TPR) repeat protein